MLRAGRSWVRIPLGQRDLLRLSKPVLWPTQPPIQWVPGLSQGGKAAGATVDHPPPSSAEIRTYTSTSVPSTACHKVTFKFTIGLHE